MPFFLYICGNIFKMQMPMNANKTLLTAAMVMSLFATMSCTNTTGTKDNNKPETSINREARQAEGTDELMRQRYDGCRILDHDYDNGYLEVKIVHDGTEKVALFDVGCARCGKQGAKGCRNA